MAPVHPTSTHPTLDDLGWSRHFADQITPEDAGHSPARIAQVSRSGALALTDHGPVNLRFPPDMQAGTTAVGDWVLYDPETRRVTRLLDRRSVLSRRAAGVVAKAQLIAANVDTLFIVTSCNADFNLARLERYVAMALDAGSTPVIVLTKTDQTDEADRYIAEARDISDRVRVVALNARDLAQLVVLQPWCGTGSTVALLGSSGVGKSTLINGLTGDLQSTADIREDDAKGRHTTTSRSLHRVLDGGWLIDMPGMRELGMHDVAAGIDLLFDDLAALAETCRFRDCAHDVDAGCALRDAVARGEISEARLDRWLKLKREDAHNVASIAAGGRRDRPAGRTVKRSAKPAKPKRR